MIRPSQQVRHPLLRLHHDEIIVDSFAGGGGASLGIELALGRSPDIAINHDPEAIAMHQANHPHTRHYCESVWDVSPRKATGGRPVGLAWFSPDCKHFSKAKGGKPVNKEIRGLAWVVIRWARDVKPRVIILENVEEFQTWGPLLPDGKPCPARKGFTFRRWVSELEKLGYQVEHRELRACDFGAPTTRKRLFLIARCDGAPIVWPEPTHGPGRPEPHHTAAECIDWSLPCPSIFERQRPLADNTMRRIARGLKRYVIDAPEPFIVSNMTNNVPRPVSEPLSTLLTGNHKYLATPYLARLAQTGGNGAYTNGVDEPLTTITSKAEHLLVSPTLVQTGYGEREGQAPRCLDIQQPLGSTMDEPVATITACDHHSLVACHLQRDFGRSVGSDAADPLPTTTAGGGGKSALIASHLVKLRGGLADHHTTAQDLRGPAPTLTAGGTHLAEVRAFLVKYYGTDGDPVLGQPLHTITTRDRFGLVTVAGEDYAIADISMRMLAPRELFRAQGFPDTYRIDVPFGPHRGPMAGKPLSKTAQVRMCGNSVSPAAGRALVLANVGQGVAVDRSLPWEPGRFKPGEQMHFFDALETAGA